MLISCLLILPLVYGRVLIYNTEKDETFEKFDCVYNMNDNGEEITYCRRLNDTQLLDRERMFCENQGEKILFRQLVERNIQPSEILRWSSSVEIADSYARIFYNGFYVREDGENFICNCTQEGTFGRYCEYKLTHGKMDFSEVIKVQFENKRTNDSWNTQRFGKILCYETVPCDGSKLCLDWREISDGFQRCVNGIDEQNWDKLEFNECEDDEFRCRNGMCIAEEFWLDGDLDCMDWSDELFRYEEESCPSNPSAIYCDEHLCNRQEYSCGDGQCILWQARIAFQRLYSGGSDCWNKRNLNYMCEVSVRQPTWTLESGLCWADKNYDDPRYPPWEEISTSKLTTKEICQYLVRCMFSNGTEHDCPCHRRSCPYIILEHCRGNHSLISYPPEGVISPFMFFYYNTYDWGNLLKVNVFILGGSGTIRCRGLHKIISHFGTVNIINLLRFPNLYLLLCDPTYSDSVEMAFDSPFQNHKFCWNDSSTFNGRPYAVHPDTCQIGGQCISQYRIRDGFRDCLGFEDEDEIFEKNFCSDHVARHRFQCFSNNFQCVTIEWLGSGTRECANSYDEVWYGSSTSIRKNSKCYETDQSDCDAMKQYIRDSAFKNVTQNVLNVNPEETGSVKTIPFPFYCNSFFDLDNLLDESLSVCKNWICPKDQYQCQTGQCIELEWVCDGEWDCSDASDEEAIVLIRNESIHNARLDRLQIRLEECRKRYANSTFSSICNSSFEFGCYRSGVLDPLDIRLNRPCINLTQIGDGIENCYNAYDERNTFLSNSTVHEAWGFQLQCDSKVEQYLFSCSVLTNNCSRVLCSNQRDTSGQCSREVDAFCLEENRCVKDGRCNGTRECLHGDDEYWCAFGTLDNKLSYRMDKRVIREQLPNFHFHSKYPFQSGVIPERQTRDKAIEQTEQSPIEYSYVCNRGVAILELNQTRCMCPPAYYGHWCEFSATESVLLHK